MADCRSSLATSLALIERFRSSLGSAHDQEQSYSGASHVSPLALSKTAAESLKATTTKISLLAITAPFTDTAVVTILKVLNDSILPSIVTAALLVTPTSFPASFSVEARRLTSSVLLEFAALLNLVEQRATDGKGKSEPNKTVKQAITEATGRVWEACDAVVNFSTQGIPAFIASKCEQWLALMKDAVAELNEWDPSEDVDDDVFGIADSDDESHVVTDKVSDQDQVTIATGVKDQAMKVLSRIPQACHVVIKQRLAKLPPDLQSGAQKLSQKQKALLENTVNKMRTVSECIDESAEGLYLGNPELCLKKAGEARAVTIDIVESLLTSWQPTNAESKEDVFVKRALTWIQQVEATPVKAASST